MSSTVLSSHYGGIDSGDHAYIGAVTQYRGRPFWRKQSRVSVDVIGVTVQGFSEYIYLWYISFIIRTRFTSTFLNFFQTSVRHDRLGESIMDSRG